MKNDVLTTSFRTLVRKSLTSQTLNYLVQIFVLQQEQFLLTTFRGFRWMESFVKIFPLIFLVQFELPEFFEQFFANKKMRLDAAGAMNEVKREEFYTNWVFLLCMIVIPAVPYICGFQVKEDYTMFLLSTIIGLVGPFKSSAYSQFGYKQNYICLMTGKMLTVALHYFTLMFIYSFYTRDKDFSTWPSGFAKPAADIVVYIGLLIVLHKGNIFGARISLDESQLVKSSFKLHKNDIKEIGKNVLAFLQFIVFFVSRPVVYLFMAYKVDKLTNTAKRQHSVIDLYLYIFYQQSLSLISKGIHSAIMTVMPTILYNQQFKKMRLLNSYGLLIGFIINEILCALLYMFIDSIFVLFVNKDNDPIIKAYYDAGLHKQLFGKTMFLIGTEVYQNAVITYAYISNKHFIPFIIGTFKIISGVYFIINIDSSLGQNASYKDAIYYFELLSTVVSFIFCTYAFITLYTDFKESKAAVKIVAKEVKRDDFMMG
ncbi:Hypothetical_protein [Hexamita inflata]|uniref:Hypothetical_protein n=1 Tax=Hexamita inflata TaxID=28002 RepID=A0AA86TJ42_9EUKA|nr:Hypothetical protein HINF_LOCUS2268 [Hexamita inflata]